MAEQKNSEFFASGALLESKNNEVREEFVTWLLNDIWQLVPIL